MNDPSLPVYSIEVLSLVEESVDSGTVLEQLEQPIRSAVAHILREAQCESADLSITVLTDEMMHEANRQYLSHDYPTDVLSFRLDDEPEQNIRVEGEVLVSWDTAVREAKDYGWESQHECLLYVVHGCLHLVGHDDHDLAKRRVMREAERSVLAIFGLTPPYSENESAHGDQQEAGS